MSIAMLETRNHRPIRVGLVTSRGGHLKQLFLLREAYVGCRCFLVTTDGPEELQLGNLVQDNYFVNDLDEGRWCNPIRFLQSLIQYLRIFWKERPDFLISTGAGSVVPGFLLARLMDTKTIYIEAGARVRTLSKTGKICYRLAHIFLVQYPDLALKYPRAYHFGAIYENLRE